MRGSRGQIEFRKFITTNCIFEELVTNDWEGRAVGLQVFQFSNKHSELKTNLGHQFVCTQLFASQATLYDLSTWPLPDAWYTLGRIHWGTMKIDQSLFSQGKLKGWSLFQYKQSTLFRLLLTERCQGGRVLPLGVSTRATDQLMVWAVIGFMFCCEIKIDLLWGLLVRLDRATVTMWWRLWVLDSKMEFWWSWTFTRILLWPLHVADLREHAYTLIPNCASLPTVHSSSLLDSALCVSLAGLHTGQEKCVWWTMVYLEDEPVWNGVLEIMVVATPALWYIAVTDVEI